MLLPSKVVVSYGYNRMCDCGEHESVEAHFIQELEEISFRLILSKILYYYPEAIGKAASRYEVGDDQYDDWERRYLKLCEILGRPNKLVHKEWPGVPEHLNGKGMMEVDFNDNEVDAVVKRFL